MKPKKQNLKKQNSDQQDEATTGVKNRDEAAAATATATASAPAQDDQPLTRGANSPVIIKSGSTADTSE